MYLEQWSFCSSLRQRRMRSTVEYLGSTFPLSIFAIWAWDTPAFWASSVWDMPAFCLSLLISDSSIITISYNSMHGMMR